MNFNNDIGVPLTILKFTTEHNVAVVEIGTTKPGDIIYLLEILQPTDGIITHIGLEHLEGLGDIEGVEKEETTLFR